MFFVIQIITMQVDKKYCFYVCFKTNYNIFNKIGKYIFISRFIARLTIYPYDIFIL